MLLLCTGCVPAHRQASWSMYPLQRRVPHDGLAVVSQPDGYGLHIWIDTDTRRSGVCRPRWTPNAARLFNGNGTAPFSSGLVPHGEFFAVVARKDVMAALRLQSRALCEALHPKRTFIWVEPPLAAKQVKPEAFPLLEEPDLLSEPAAVREQENQLLDGQGGAAP